MDFDDMFGKYLWLWLPPLVLFFLHRYGFIAQSVTWNGFVSMSVIYFFLYLIVVYSIAISKLDTGMLITRYFQFPIARSLKVDVGDFTIRTDYLDSNLYAQWKLATITFVYPKAAEVDLGARVMVMGRPYKVNLMSLPVPIKKAIVAHGYNTQNIWFMRFYIDENLISDDYHSIDEIQAMFDDMDLRINRMQALLEGDKNVIEGEFKRAVRVTDSVSKKSLFSKLVDNMRPENKE